MKNVFINCSAKEFYEVLKPLLLTLEGYTMYEDEWYPSNHGCRVDSGGDWFPFSSLGSYEEVDLADFIAAVKPKATVTVSEMTDDEFNVFCTEIKSVMKQVGEMIEAYETNHNGVNLKQTPPFDLRGKFIPCTEEQVDEVCDLLDKLGCLPWVSRAAGGYWGARCKGVKVYPTNYYLTNEHQDGCPTLTLEELREIAKNVKL
jgi:hypothetical protein